MDPLTADVFSEGHQEPVLSRELAATVRTQSIAFIVLSLGMRQNNKDPGSKTEYAVEA